MSLIKDTALSLLALLLAACAPGPAGAELAVAAASDLKPAMDRLGAAFRRDHPEIRLRVTFGSSGNFYAQLLQQAPFDVFLSADSFYPRKLAEKGLALPASEFTYAIGRLAVWLPAASPAAGLGALAQPGVRRIAIANPAHAPYGRAAEAALRHFGLYTAVQPRLVYGENVAQAMHFARSGSAQAAIVALSLTLGAGGETREIPQQAYPRLEQGGLILKWTRQPAAARAFRAFLLSQGGRAILAQSGFFLPEV
ncbi:MAG: molybdate ABC transporter substrate-binding protein [Acidobacteria bacterium]|nr:molybdate ABC transporter substrate-binding protein [Acidobacteriota bacterium]